MSKLHKINVGLIRKYIQENPVKTVSLNNEPLCKLTVGGDVLWDKHPEVIWTVDKEATSATSGQKHSKCIYCNEVVEIADIPATGYFRYRQLDDGTLAISAWYKYKLPKVLVIPGMYDGKYVTRIDDNAFSGTDIEVLVVPRGIHIGNSAFEDCKNLIGIAHNDGSSQLYGIIESRVFNGCESLLSVMIQDGAEVHPGAFHYSTKVFFEQDETEEYSGYPNYYFYSEEEKSGNYWCYSDISTPHGIHPIPTIWCSDCVNIGHSDFDRDVSPTCTDYGYMKYGCGNDVTTFIYVFDEPLDHNWVDATCTTPKTCSRCGKTEGSNLGHRWVEGDCTTKTTCRVCGTTQGDFIHNYSDWVYNEDAQSECRVCEICGNKEIRDYAVQYTKLPNGTYTASAAPNAEGIICIKTTYNDAIVTEIAPEGFKGTNITGIDLPGTLTTIGDSAFEGCSKLKNIIINAGLKHIGKYAFKYCNSLEYVFYKGNEETWKNIEICKDQSSNGDETVDIETNTYLLTATRLYYSPASKSGAYWHYSNEYYWRNFPAIPWGDLDNFEVVEVPGSNYNKWLIRVKEGVQLEGTVILPPILDNKRIDGLADMALYRNYTPQKKRISIKIPESYKYIYDGAFAYCSNAGTIHIPKNIIYVGKGAFAFTSPTFVYFDHHHPGEGGMQWHPQWNEYSPVKV